MEQSTVKNCPKNNSIKIDLINPSPKLSHFRNTNSPSIGFENLNYEIVEIFKYGFKHKLLLQNLSGYFMLHSLNGLLGPSGCGKTTLLNCLNGNFATECKNSKIFLNSETHLTTVSSFFIEQHIHENIVGTMTIREIFKFAFKFKNGPNKSQDLSHWIDHIMQELMLPNELLERQFCKCSGGQKKRISIAQELMSLEMPSFLFVDEPTTGLDSVCALEVINCLKNLVARHRITVIASIHAPNSEMLQAFDQVYVLAKGGVAIYSGDPACIKSYLQAAIQMNISKSEPPIEAIIKIACKGTNDRIVSLLAQKCSDDQQQQLSLAVQSDEHFVVHSRGLTNTRKCFKIYDLFVEICRQFRLSFVHNLKSFLAINTSILVLLWFVSTFFRSEMTVEAGCISLQKDAFENSSNCLEELKNNSLMRENITFLWYTFLFSGLLTISTSAIFICPFVKVFLSEHRNNWYSFGVFYLSNSITSLLQVTCFVAVMVISSYYLTNQRAIDNYQLNWHRLGLYFVIIWLYSVFMQAIGQLIGIIFLRHLEVAITLSVIVNSSISIFNPLFFDLDKTDNHFLVTVSDLMAVKYLIKTLIYTFYGLGRCESEMKISIYMIIYNVNERQIFNYLLRMAANVIVIRILTWIVMFGQLCEFKSVLPKWLISKNLTTGIRTKSPKANKNVQTHDAAENFFKYDEFLRNKIIIGWRKLTLFSSTPTCIRSSPVNSIGNRPDLILNELNGQFKFGTLNGLMGASGSGKTTLLKVLNGQCKTRLSTETQFYLSQYTKIATCFIKQEVSGHLMAGLTVKQLLLYASRLKNPYNSTNHSTNALSWLSELELDDISNTNVDKCSGGERKRLALALELTQATASHSIIYPSVNIRSRYKIKLTHSNELK